MTDSVDVLNMLKLVYTIYALVAISVCAWFAYKLSSPGKTEPAKSWIFYIYISLLIVIGVSIHLFTFHKIPWVEMDYNRREIKADQIVQITMKEHKFILPSERISIKCDQKVLFEVVTADLTYGFGIFRQNGTLVTQMQVVPGNRNDLLWQFSKNGIYSIRSTEYSGPKGALMIEKNVIEVTGCDDNDKFSVNSTGGNQ